ncbi:MAG: hypothetical protein KAX78_10605, partial [Phycisphaerae bacterium]|nr:hypothetical protein [Phycisphaerae bacterium]
ARAAPAVLAVLLIALGVRIYTIQHTENIARDGTVYLHMARQLAHQPLVKVLRSYHYHPGYPGVVAGAATILKANWPDGWVAVGQWVSLVSGMVALTCLYLISRAAMGHRCALIALLLFALGGPFVRISCDVISDTQAVAFALLAVTAGLGARKLLSAESVWTIPAAGAAGLCAALGYLTRPEHLLAAAIAAALLIGVGALTRRGRIIQLAAAGALGVWALAIVLPYAIAIGDLTQKKSLSDFVTAGGGSWFLATLCGPAGLTEALRRVTDRTREAMGTVVFVMGAVCWVTWLGKYVLRLRLPPAVIIKPTRGGAVAMFAATAVMFPLLVILEFNLGDDESRYISTRHALMHAMLLAPAAGAGVMILAEWTVIIGRRLKLKARPRLSLAVWVLIAASGVLGTSRCVLHKGKGAYRQAGKQLRERFGPGHYILGPDSRFAFFAGAPGEQFAPAAVMPPSLRVQDTACAENLLTKAFTEIGGRRYSFLGVTCRMPDQGANVELIEPLVANKRLEGIGQYSIGRAKKLWVFRIIPANPHR